MLDYSRRIYEKNRILSDQKCESFCLVHIVEQWILYKILYTAMLMNSIFPNVLFAQMRGMPQMVVLDLL
jgi:hypothetical protein